MEQKRIVLYVKCRSSGVEQQAAVTYLGSVYPQCSTSPDCAGLHNAPILPIRFYCKHDFLMFLQVVAATSILDLTSNKKGHSFVDGNKTEEVSLKGFTLT